MIFYGCGLPRVTAAPVPWNDEIVSYTSSGRPIKQVLKDVLATQAFPVVITGDIRGEVGGQFNERAAAVFKKLDAVYDFAWFFDGAVLYISPSNDVRSEIIQAGTLSQARVDGMLGRIGLAEERFPVRVFSGGVLVSGPSRYVDLVGKALRAESGVSGRTNVDPASAVFRAPQKQQAPPQRRVRIFQLTHAQAGDVVRRIGDEREAIPGVATMLRRLDGAREALVMESAGDPGKEEAAEAHDDSMPGVLERRQGGREAAPAADLSVGSDTQVEADIRTNSVIVHANNQLLDYYAEVIKRLDRPQQLVQIDVTIVEISSSALRDLGVELGVTHPRFSAAAGETLERGASGVFQGYVGAAARHVAVRISALEKKGKVRVLSRPKLVTLENIEASMGNQSTAYVKVAGAYETDLYPVRAGLQVRVTPRVVSKAGDPARIHLALDIADGYLDQELRVDGVPVSNESSISTQAVMGEGQMLLVGGHQYENVGQDHSGVPGLSRLPLIGGLFRHGRNRHELKEHLFLITPRLVKEDSIPLQELAATDAPPAPRPAPVAEKDAGQRHGAIMARR